MTMETYGNYKNTSISNIRSSSSSSPQTMLLCGGGSSSSNNNNINNNVNIGHHFVSSSSSSTNGLFLPLPLTSMANPTSHTCSTLITHNIINNNFNNSGFYYMDNTTTNNHPSNDSLKAKIMAHPHYHRLLSAYINCQKVGAPPEVVARFEEAYAAATSMVPASGTSCIGEDPALDQFMEAYCEMLIKYEQELSKPFKEALLFLQRVESEFKVLSISSPICGDGDGPSGEEVIMNNSMIDPQAEDQELKSQLLRRYSGYLGSLKQEFMKKRKKGKLPKQAREQLLEWWNRHYKWPYPSESQKVALAESTGLDQKQINNWFINQRKRHWKPSEDMQFVVMDSVHPHYYIDTILGNPFPMDVSSTFI